MSPELVVRSWRGVHTERELARRSRSEVFGYEWSEDHQLEAHESRRIHQLRGMVLAQVSEIEDLFVTLVELAREKHPDWFGGSPDKMIPVSKALAVVEVVAQRAGHGQMLATRLPMFRWMIARRNQLVHACVHIGFSQIHPDAPREAVIAILREIRPNGRSVPWDDAPILEGYRNPGDWGWDGDSDEISEYYLEADLRRIQVCLDAAVDVYEILNLE